MLKRKRNVQRRVPAKRRRTGGRKRLYRGRTRSRRQVHHFVRSLPLQTVLGNAVNNPYLNVFTWNLNQTVSAGELSVLYDQYRVNMVVLKFWLRQDPGAQAAASATYPRLYWYKDWDDSSVPASLNEFRERPYSCKVLNPTRPVVIKVRPAVLNEVYRSAIATSYSPKWKQWIDMTTTDVPHYGLKWGMDQFTNTNYILDIEVRMYVSCRNVR